MVGERCGWLVCAAAITSLTLAGCGQAPDNHVAMRAPASDAPAADAPAGCVAAEPAKTLPATPAPDAGDRVTQLEAHVLAFAKAHAGEVMGEARCSELADLALVASGARTFSDFGSTGDGDDYVWGSPVAVKDARPGDILQLKDAEIATVTTTPLGHYRERYVAARQTGVIEENDGGAMVVFEQNVGGDPAVRRTHLYAAAGVYARDAEGDVDARAVTEVKVRGSIRAYRPQGR